MKTDARKFHHLHGVPALALSILFLPGAQSQDTFTLSVSGPRTLYGPVSETAVGFYTVNLTHEGPGPGAEAYSFGIVCENVTEGGHRSPCNIVGIDIDGTDTLASLTPGLSFHSEGVTSGQNNEGAVAAAILQFGGGVVLPPVASLANIEINSTVEEKPTTLQLRFRGDLLDQAQPRGSRGDASSDDRRSGYRGEEHHRDPGPSAVHPRRL